MTNLYQLVADYINEERMIKVNSSDYNNHMRCRNSRYQVCNEAFLEGTSQHDICLGDANKYCYEILPYRLNSKELQDIRQQIDNGFGPYLASAIISNIRQNVEIMNLTKEDVIREMPNVNVSKQNEIEGFGSMESSIENVIKGGIDIFKSIMDNYGILVVFIIIIITYRY